MGKSHARCPLVIAALHPLGILLAELVVSSGVSGPRSPKLRLLTEERASLMVPLLANSPVSARSLSNKCHRWAVGKYLLQGNPYLLKTDDSRTRIWSQMDQDLNPSSTHYCLGQSE